MNQASRISEFLLWGRCGAHTSLYGTLDKKYVPNLEYTIWLRRIGEYDQAHAIFRDELSNAANVPVVLIERCELFSAQRRMRELFLFLEPVIHRLRSSNTLFGWEERQLLGLFFAHASLYHKGNIQPALEAMHSVKTWLGDVSVEDYSDTMVRLTCSIPFNRVLTMYRQAVCDSTSVSTASRRT
jgi:hypothetical protein